MSLCSRDFKIHGRRLINLNRVYQNGLKDMDARLKDVEEISEFVEKFSPQNDLKLIKRLHGYESIDPSISLTALNKIQNHL